MNQKLLLAYNLADMAQVNIDNHEVLEYLSDISFNCSRLFSDTGDTIDWYGIFAEIDKACDHQDVEAKNKLISISQKLKARIN